MIAPQFDPGAQFFALWLADQRATAEAVEQQKRELGAVCPVCGATYQVRYGRLESAYFVIHPLGNCVLAFDSHHGGAQTEQEALERFAKREETPRPATPDVPALALAPLPAQESGPAPADENFVFEASS